MFHHDRVWRVIEVESAEELAHLLTATTQTLCSAFVVAGHPEYLFLNDATSEDGAAEFAVVHGGLAAANCRQIESITFSWCSYKKALKYIRTALSGGYDEESFFPGVLTARIESCDEHGRCTFCA
jgi:hypothetical protein